MIMFPMVSGERMPEDTPETGQEADERFVENTDHLFALARSAEHSSPGLFFTTGWNAEGDMGDPEILSILPTGARKQERHDGLFGQAQFRVKTLGSDSTEARFVWVRTPPQATTPLVQASAAALEEDLGYMELTGVKVSEVMGEQVQSLSDYLHLAKEMIRRDIVFPLKFRESALGQMKQFFDGEATLKVEKESLEALGYIIDGLNFPYAMKIRHTILTDIIKSIIDEPYEIERKYFSFSDRDDAAVFLSKALQTRVIPREEGLMRRLLPISSLYEYPFATELLHTRLVEKPLNSNAKTVAGVDLGRFISDYIMTILRTRAHDAGTHDAQWIVEGLQTALAVTDATNDPQFLTYLANLQDTGNVVLAALQQMQSTDPEIAASQQATDELSAEIINVLLKPIISRKIGRGALGVSIDEEDIL